MADCETGNGHSIHLSFLVLVAVNVEVNESQDGGIIVSLCCGNAHRLNDKYVNDTMVNLLGGDISCLSTLDTVKALSYSPCMTWDGSCRCDGDSYKSHSVPSVFSHLEDYKRRWGSVNVCDKYFIGVNYFIQNYQEACLSDGITSIEAINEFRTVFDMAPSGIELGAPYHDHYWKLYIDFRQQYWYLNLAIIDDYQYMTVIALFHLLVNARADMIHRPQEPSVGEEAIGQLAHPFSNHVLRHVSKHPSTKLFADEPESKNLLGKVGQHAEGAQRIQKEKARLRNPFDGLSAVMRFLLVNRDPSNVEVMLDLECILEPKDELAMFFTDKDRIPSMCFDDDGNADVNKLDELIQEGLVLDDEYKAMFWLYIRGGPSSEKREWFLSYLKKRYQVGFPCKLTTENVLEVDAGSREMSQLLCDLILPLIVYHAFEEYYHPWNRGEKCRDGEGPDALLKFLLCHYSPVGIKLIPKSGRYGNLPFIDTVYRNIYDISHPIVGYCLAVMCLTTTAMSKDGLLGNLNQCFALMGGVGEHVYPQKAMCTLCKSLGVVSVAYFVAFLTLHTSLSSNNVSFIG